MHIIQSDNKRRITFVSGELDVNNVHKQIGTSPYVSDTVNPVLGETPCDLHICVRGT